MATHRDQLVVRSGLDHLPALQDDDPVGGFGRLQPVGDDDVVRPLRHLLHRRGDPRLGDEVEIRRGLVEQQDDRVDELGSSERDQLALTGRERPPALGQLVVVAAGQVRDEVVRADGPGGRLDLARRSPQAVRRRCCPGPCR